MCADAVMLVSDEGKPQPFDNDDVSVSAAGVATDHYIHRLMLIMMMMMMMMMMMVLLCLQRAQSPDSPLSSSSSRLSPYGMVSFHTRGGRKSAPPTPE